MIIYCPRCGIKVMSWDEKTTINLIAKCKKCERVVEYDVKEDKVEILGKPIRSQSSGLRFY